MRVLAALSGGVDSAVAAALLQQAGHGVIGVTLQLYDHGAATARRGACCAGEDIHDARRVADRLGIPHYVLDREARFAEAVVQPFADAYAAGETPVPCVRCNATVKFADLTALARELGCDALATGHYARRVDGTAGPELHRARDPARDQSWFLHATTREQLAFARFPVGELPDKAAVRAVAARRGLDVAEKPDSQDLCFVPSGRYDAVVARLRPDAMQAGALVDDGRVVGRHDGVARFTVGQARGVPPAADGTRRYVVGIDAAARRVLVGAAAALPRTSVAVAGMNWLIDPPNGALACTVKLRAREVPAPATVAWDPVAARLTVWPDRPTIAAPGQSCVLYAGDRVLGGGTILAADAIAAAA